MSKNNIQIGNTTIQYGITLVRELLNAGYTVSDFEQIIKEPTLATCNLRKNNEIVAILSFYNIREEITIGQLGDIPIDLVLLRKTRKKVKGKVLSPQQALRNRIIWTIGIHLAAAAIFFCIHALPALYSWVQRAEFRGPTGGHMSMGMLLLVLPTVLVAFIWCGDVVGEKGNIAKKILLSFWLILNVIISVAYLVLIDNVFTHRFF